MQEQLQQVLGGDRGRDKDGGNAKDLDQRFDRRAKGSAYGVILAHYGLARA